MLFLWLICLLILSVFLKLYVYRRRLLKYVENIPTSREKIPFIGIAHRFIWKNSEQIMKILIEISAEINTPTKFCVGPLLIILLDKPEDIQAILTSPDCYEKPYIYKFLHNDLSLFASPTKLWKNDRKLLTPTLNFKVVMSFMPIFNKQANLMIQNMEKELNKVEPFDVSTYLFACTLDMICETTLGYDVQVQNNENKIFLHSCERFLQMVAERIFNILLHPDFIYNKTKAYKLEKEQFDIAVALPQKILANKIKEFYQNKSQKNIEKNGPSEEYYEQFDKPQLFIDQIIKFYDEGQMTELNMAQQVNFMILAGNETTALSMSFTVLLLAMHPEIQERTVQEISDVYESVDTYSDFALISKLYYTEMVIREAMRLFPVAPFILRTVLADTKIVNCNNCTIPKNAYAGISIWGVHHSREIWGPDADKFNPENFLPEKVAARHPYSFIPFSGGSRNCLGIKYAFISMKIMLAALLRNYKFSTELKLEDLRTTFGITMKLANKHMVKVERRNFKTN